MLANIRIVLVNPSHPGNIGATARAMKNMCLDKLFLVAPKTFPSAEATARASGADDVLFATSVCASLDEAIGDCRLVIGASARLRNVSWPQLDPSQCAVKLIGESCHAPVAVVFGRERSGLSNVELERCHYLVHIPANPHYNSLNLAAAVQLIAYEIYQNSARLQANRVVEKGTELASAGEMEGFFTHLEQTLWDLRFLDPNHPHKLMRRLRRLFNRARLDKDELNILRGILSAAQARKSITQAKRD